MTRIPVAEIRAAAKALDGEHDTVEAAAEAAIRAVDEAREKSTQWVGLIDSGMSLPNKEGTVRRVLKYRGPWPTESQAKRDAMSLAADHEPGWAFTWGKLTRETDGYRKG